MTRKNKLFSRFCAPEIITSLLIRLPVKSLLRFRCVSKPWCTQIDSPDFVKLHLSHSIKTSSNLTPLAQYENTLYSLDSDSLKKLVKIETPFLNPNEKFGFSSCNGLILIQATDNVLKFNLRLFLCNPSTRKHLLLPTPPPITKYAGMGSFQSSNCLGYDVVNDDYKVFNIVLFVDKTNKFIGCEARIYRLKSNSWASWHIDRDFAKDMLFNRLLEPYVNGALHTPSKDNRSILALDVAKETFGFLPMPNFGNKNLICTGVCFFDGCLAILCRYLDNRTDIWVMKEYGVKESWTMLFSVKPKNPCKFVLPMLYSKSRTEVLLTYDCAKLVWYDLKKRTYRGFQVSGLPIQFGLLVSVESLVSVGGIRKVDEKKQHREEKMKLEIVKKKRDDFLSKGFKLKL